VPRSFLYDGFQELVQWFIPVFWKFIILNSLDLTLMLRVCESFVPITIFYKRFIRRCIPHILDILRNIKWLSQPQKVFSCSIDLFSTKRTSVDFICSNIFRRTETNDGLACNHAWHVCGLCLCNSGSDLFYIVTVN
jgi:hypothetical protein